MVRFNLNPNPELRATVNDNQPDKSGMQVEGLKSEIANSQHPQEDSLEQDPIPRIAGDPAISSETALRRSEALLNATQRLSKVGGWEWNVEKKTMFWTEETYRIHDFDPNELIPGTPEHIEKKALLAMNLPTALLFFKPSRVVLSTANPTISSFPLPLLWADD
jgi:hypothetical protein